MITDGERLVNAIASIDLAIQHVQLAKRVDVERRRIIIHRLLSAEEAIARARFEEAAGEES